jgi:hypothetical protein
MLNVFKTTIALAKACVKGKVERVQLRGFSMIWADEIIRGYPILSLFLRKGGIRARLALGFPQPSVTSDLDPRIQTADHGQGGGCADRNRERGSDSFVLKIFTFKPLPLKILQSILANPGAGSGIQRWGEGHFCKTRDFSRNGLAEKALISPARRNFFYHGSPLQ